MKRDAVLIVGSLLFMLFTSIHQANAFPIHTDLQDLKLLDALIFSVFEVDDTTWNVKAGRHPLVWLAYTGYKK